MALKSAGGVVGYIASRANESDTLGAMSVYEVCGTHLSSTPPRRSNPFGPVFLSECLQCNTVSPSPPSFHYTPQLACSPTSRFARAMQPLGSSESASPTRVTLIRGAETQSLLPESPTYRYPPVVWNAASAPDGVRKGVYINCTITH